jgi:GNAT superfamily N-acetyltransferase
MFPRSLRSENVPLARRAETGAATAAYEAWLNTGREGFHQQPATADQVEQLFQTHEVDARVLTGVYDDSLPADLVDPLVPVATYASFAKTLNIGAGLVPAHLVTMVTVRPTHRRRGILRELMTGDLARAKAAGYPVAALTASEATIYGRFGFGRCTWMCAGTCASTQRPADRCCRFRRMRWAQSPGASSRRSTHPAAARSGARKPISAMPLHAGARRGRTPIRSCVPPCTWMRRGRSRDT